MKTRILCMMLLLCGYKPAIAQHEEIDDFGSDSLMGVIDTLTAAKYPYIRYAENRFSFYNGETPAFERFYAKFDSLINYHKQQLVIYHIGGSHIQADLYSHRMRTYLNTWWPELTGARGLVFPFTAAQTNNPSNYRSEYTGEWTNVRCVNRKDTSLLGLTGISISTRDSIASIKISYREKEPHRYPISSVKVYHNMSPAYWVSFADSLRVESTLQDSAAGYTLFSLRGEYDTVPLQIQRMLPDNLGGEFTLYGIELMNKRPGVVYNSIGINGAAFSHYLRCQDFEKQLAQLPPDLFIISIGTNDANVPAADFKPETFKANYEALVQRVLRVNPNAALLFTVPNDAYYYRRYPNRNVEKMRDVIQELAGKYGAGVWNFYDIMGGFNSSNRWFKDNLMHRDRVHFTNEGYALKGDLFFEAFLKYLEEFEYKRLLKLSNPD